MQGCRARAAAVQAAAAVQTCAQQCRLAHSRLSAHHCCMYAGYAAQSLLAAIGCVQFVSNVVFAYVVLKEQVGRRLCCAWTECRCQPRAPPACLPAATRSRVVCWRRPPASWGAACCWCRLGATAARPTPTPACCTSTSSQSTSLTSASAQQWWWRRMLLTGLARRPSCGLGEQLQQQPAVSSSSSSPPPAAAAAVAT